jgi:hypothetical protein
MIKRTLSLLILLLLTAACQPTGNIGGLPTDIPFPTMTVGQRLDGQLPTPGGRPDVLGANPATAVAVLNRPTVTPDTRTCPARDDEIELDSKPDSRVGAIDTIQRFLNSGGSPERLREGMIADWEAFGETGTGYLRDDVDLTGEGTPELVIGYIAPGDVGTLLIFGCQAGRYQQLFETIADGIEPPQLIWLGEMNNNPTQEAVFSRRQCSDAEFCEFQTQIITWSATQGRFVNLMPTPITTLELPSVRDMDNDEVAELVVSLTSNGTSATGPLRTGVNIYDWNGEQYVLSIIQLDAPRYYIQVVHEGDKSFSNLQMENAVLLYELALTNEDFRNWFNDDPITVISYAYYRLILAYAYMGNGGGIIQALERMRTELATSAEGEIGVYVELSETFVQALSDTNDLHESCLAVQSVIEARPEAINLLNRYGNSSPQYDALQLCPY